MAFSDLADEFADRGLPGTGRQHGLPNSSIMAWRQSAHDDLRDLKIPMLADVKRELSGALGILNDEEGVANRADFLVDPAGRGFATCRSPI